MSPDSPAQRYRRRRRFPILVVLAVLLIGTGVAWFQVLKPVSAASTSCNQPGPAPTATRSTPQTAASGAVSPSGAARTSTTARSTLPSPPSTAPASVRTSLGGFTGPASLTGIRPGDPATVALQVFNASKIAGQAKTVTNDLRAAGFTSILGGANDRLYPAHDLVCVAEIRYGEAGIPAARTVLLAVPCAQLVLDDRISDSVDLSLGARYTFQPLSAEVRTALRRIHEAAIPPAVIEGQTAAPRPQPVIPPLPSTAGCG